jgi:predicted oxidoreductase (fatty acid repression mutant protein)
MHQFAAWTALEAEGLGANLQHYNPLPDQKASEIWNIPLGAREKLPAKAVEDIAGGRLFVHGKSA